MRRYVFDKDNLNLKKDRLTFRKAVKWLVVVLLASVALSIVYYAIFALVFSTPTEARLRRQNRIYREQIPQLEEKADLLSDVVGSLKHRDDEIYNRVFHTAAPDIDPTSSITAMKGLDSAGDSDFVKYAREKIDSCFAMAGRTEENFRAIMAKISAPGTVLPPLSSPLKNLNYSQVSASTGDKINPFYKVPVRHNGLDIIVSPDVPVFCTADGTVSDVVRSGKGMGNTVTVTHQGGYRTVYAHLARIDAIKGRNVKRGSVIGTVGMSGNSFAPHLHYEVHRDTLTVDPVNFLFADVRPEDYLNMLVMSASTGQSMD